MTVAIRADGNRLIGIGHLTRCISLANALEAEGADCVFVIRDMGYDARSFVKSRGFSVRMLPAPDGSFLPAAAAPPHAAWAGMNGAADAVETAKVLSNLDITHVLIDHYGYDTQWHEAARHALGCPIAAVDDLADRAMSVDLIIDHNYHADHAAKYADVLTADTPICGGPDFALLSPLYADAPRWAEQSSGGIGIFLGGGDLMGLTPAFLDRFRANGYVGPVEIVTTSAATNLAELQSRADSDPAFVLSLDLPDLTEFYARRTVQIGAGGGASWERCCIGAPTVVTATADNHRVVLDALDAVGAAISAPRDDVVNVALELLKDRARREELSKAARSLIDGRGAIRAARKVLNL